MKEWKQLLCLNLVLVLLLTVLPVPVLAEDVVDAVESMVAEAPSEEVPTEVIPEEAPVEEVPAEEIPAEDPELQDDSTTGDTSTGEGDIPADHACSFGEWAVETEPTRTDAGRLVRTCIVDGCGETESHTLPMLNEKDYGVNWESDKNNTLWQIFVYYWDGQRFEFRAEHVCEFGDWRFDPYPTAQQKGFAYRSCMYCGDGWEEIDLPVLNEKNYTVTREVDEDQISWVVYTYENVSIRKRVLPAAGELDSGCPWALSEDGLLTLGEAGETWELWHYDVWPWVANVADVTAVKVLGTVEFLGGAGLFRDMSNMKTADVAGLKTDKANRIHYMFMNCRSLESVDVSGFDTSNVDNLSGMFSGCKALKHLDFSGWDTSKVVSMQSMFSNCHALQSVDVSGWDTSNVVTMQGMFGGCWELGNLDLSGWDTSNVETMRQMFIYCEGMTELDLRSFTTTQLTDEGMVDSMFKGCSALTVLLTEGTYSDAVKQQLLNEGFTLSVEEMDGQQVAKFSRKLWEWEVGMNPTLTSTGYGWMNNIATGNSYRINLPALNDTDYTVTMDEQTRVKTYVYELPEYEMTLTFTLRIPPCSDVTADGMPWEVTEAGELILGKTGKNYTFNAANGIPWADCVEFITSVKVAGPVTCTNVRGMFQNLDNLKTVDVTGLQTGSAKDFGFMFSGCTALQEIKGLKTLNTASATNMCGMFGSCYNLTELDVSGFNTAEVTEMGSMFLNCWNLTELDVSGFDTAKVVRMDDMFYDCSALTELDVSSFNTGAVQTMRRMFGNCCNLTELDVSSFDTSNVTNMGSMFIHCWNLTELDLSGFDTANVTNLVQMFAGCNELTKLDLSSFDTSAVTNAHHMFSGCWMLTELDLSSFDLNRLQSGGADNMFRDSGLQTVRTMENWGKLADQSLKAEDFVQTADDEGWLYTKGGHDWGKWELQQAPTMEKPGSLVRICLSNKNHRDTVTLPVLNDVDYTVTMDKENNQKIYAWEQGDQTITFAVELLPVSGEVNGCPWTITADGILTIGYADGTEVTLDTSGKVPNWNGYAAEIKGVKVLEGVKGGNVLSSLFNGLYNVESMDLKNLNTSGVVNMYQMFRGCSSLKSIDLSDFSTDNLQQLSYMFCDCSSLTAVDLSGFDTAKVTATNGMFDGCTALETVNLSGWDTSKAMYMVSMFYGCTMKQLDLRDLSFVSMTSNAFYGCLAEEILVKKDNLPESALNMAQDAGYVAEEVTLDGVACYRLTHGECVWRDVWGIAAPSELMPGLMVNVCNHGHEREIELPVLSAANGYTVTEKTDSGKTYTVYSMTMEGQELEFIVQHPPIAVETENLHWEIDKDGKLIIGRENSTQVLKVFASFNNLCQWSEYGRFVTAVELKGELDSGREARKLLVNLKTVETVDLTGLDTRNERDLSAMFAGLTKLTELDLSMLDTRKVVKADDMFKECGAGKITVGENWGEVTHRAALAAGYTFDQAAKTYTRPVKVTAQDLVIELPEDYIEPEEPGQANGGQGQIELHPVITVENTRATILTAEVMCAVYDKFGRFVTMDAKRIEVDTDSSRTVSDLELVCDISEVGELRAFVVGEDDAPICKDERITVVKQ